MGNWAKVWLAASLLGLVCVLSACGKDNGQDSVQANTAPPRNCWNGQCSWGASNYPGQWQAYPRYSNGAYNFAGYDNSGCARFGPNYHPYNDPIQGLICIPYDNGIVSSFQQGTWAGGYYLQGCSMLYRDALFYPNGMPNPCVGRCFPNWQANSQFGQGWNSGGWSVYGTCR